MKRETIFFILIAFGAVGQDYTPGVEDYLVKFLIPLLNPTRVFDGPTSISTHITTPSTNILPTISQMMYYNYYASSAYYIYHHNDFSCIWCLKIKPDLTEYKVINSYMHNTLAIVAVSQTRQEIVIAFRGAVNIWNVVLDAVFKCDNIPGRQDSDNIKIHSGFYIATMSLYADVVQKVSSYLKDHKNYKIVMTGHSLGAALARLTCFFFIDLNQFPGVVYELYTYGEPRVGNKEFADFMNAQPIISARVVARGDLVPHIPPTSIFGSNFIISDNYVHPQTEFWIDGKNNQKFANQSYYEDPNCSMSMGPLYNTLDHLVYFDVNLGSVAGQPSSFLSLPFNILDPVRHIPPLPKKIERSISDMVTSYVRALAPLFG